MKIRTASAVLLVVLVALLIGSLGLRRIWTADYWWQWKTGAHVSEHGVPRTAIYSYTNPDHERIELRWGYCLAIYHATRRFGHGFAVLVKALAMFAAFATVALIAARPPNLVACCAVVPVAALAASQRFFVRPEFVSYLLFALFLLILERARARPTRWLMLLPLLQIAWVNSHGWFVLGPALVGAWLTSDLLELGLDRIRKRDPDPDRRRRLRTAGILLAALGLASLLNPYFARALLLPLVQLTALHGTEMKDFYTELRSPFFFGRQYLAFDYYLLLIGMVLGSVAINLRRQRFYWSIVVAAMFYLSASAIRNLPLFSLVAIPFFLRNFAESDLWTRPWAARALPVGRIAIGTIVGCFCAFQIWQLGTDRFAIRQNDTNQFGIGVAAHRYPVRATEFYRNAGVEGRMFNSSSAGSYLMAQGLEVFIDPRGEVYMDGVIDEYRRIVRHEPSMDELVARYDFQSFFLETSLASLIQHLDGHENWRLVYLDEVAAIFLRSDTALHIPRLDLDEEWLEDLRDELPRPRRPVEQAVFARRSSPAPYARLALVCAALQAPGPAKELWEDARATAPEHFRHHAELASVTWQLGDAATAEIYQREALQRAPQNAAARLRLVEMLISRDDLESAARELDEYLELRPLDVPALALKGRISVRLERYDRARAAFLRAFELDPANAVAAYGVAMIEAQRGNLESARDWAERARDLAPDDPRILELWGVVKP